MSAGVPPANLVGLRRQLGCRASGGPCQLLVGVSRRLLVLQIKALNHVHDQIRRILSTIFDVEHLNKDHFPLLAVDSVAFDVSRMIRRFIGADDREAAHRSSEIVAGLVGFILSDLFQIIILELEQNHARLEFVKQVTPVVIDVDVSIWKNSVAAIDPRVSARLLNWLVKWWNKQMAKYFHANYFKVTPTRIAGRAREKAFSEFF